MTLKRGGPWLVSLGLHAVLVTAAAWVLASSPPGPPALRMRLAATPGAGASPATGGPGPAGALPPLASPRPGAPDSPEWNAPAPAAAGSLASPVVPVALEELLAGTSSAVAPVPETDHEGWTSPGGEGYQVPPLPPPGLAPPEGASWTLVLTIPGTGGFPVAVEGLDSGHPDLDRWLETNLRTIGFPAGLDGREYRLRWVLKLQSGRPR